MLNNIRNGQPRHTKCVEHHMFLFLSKQAFPQMSKYIFNSTSPPLFFYEYNINATNRKQKYLVKVNFLRHFLRHSSPDFPSPSLIFSMSLSTLSIPFLREKSLPNFQKAVILNLYGQRVRQAGLAHRSEAASAVIFPRREVCIPRRDFYSKMMMVKDNGQNSLF